MTAEIPIVRKLVREDYGAWLEIAAEVEPLFGPMVDLPEFQDGIRTCIDGGEAYGVEHARALAGIVALNSQKHEILWLAVRKDKRGKGFGDLLVKKVLEVFDQHEEIHVQTFASDSPEGTGARAIYRKHGFTEERDAGPNPAGVPTVIMVRRPARPSPCPQPDGPPDPPRPE